MILQKTISRLNQRQSLTAPEMAEAMEAIVTGQVNDEEIERFLLALREKGETAGEISAAAKVMRRHSLKLSRSYSDLLDTCGTGGDAQHTLNISTLAALVACAAGVRVAKHGNRSVSSLCGSADILEALGVVIDLEPEKIERAVDQLGFGFFFAPKFHPATRLAMPARKKIKGKTIFNLLGPLCNPAGAGYQLLGVYEAPLVDRMAEVLRSLGCRRALVVHGAGGLDEMSIGGPTKVAEVEDEKIKKYSVSPEEMGLRPAGMSALVCASKEDCVRAARAILKGVPGPSADVVCLNAGAGLFVAGKTASIREGVAAAQAAIARGAAQKKLEALVAFSK